MSKQTLQSKFYRGEHQDRVNHTPNGAAVVSGEILNLGNGLVGCVTSPEGIADGVLGSVATKGTFQVSKEDSGPGPTFAVGAIVGWDDTAKEAVVGGAGDFDLGACEEAAAATDNHVRTRLNENVLP